MNAVLMGGGGGGEKLKHFRGNVNETERSVRPYFANGNWPETTQCL